LPLYISVMCDLYSITKDQAAIVALVRALRDATGNLPPMPGVFPDYRAPVVRNAPDGVGELAMLRWGMPSSHQALYEAAKKRAQKLETKGKPVDLKELLKIETDAA
jgi:putative SOS response-associated peptidase YedK